MLIIAELNRLFRTYNLPYVWQLNKIVNSIMLPTQKDMGEIIKCVLAQAPFNSKTKKNDILLINY